MNKRFLLSPNTLVQDRYRIVQLLGSGGMGAVYEAIDERIKKVVAVKETFAEDEELLDAFEREAKLLARIDHRTFPQVTDYFADGESYYLIMDLIRGDDFSEMLAKRSDPFKPTDVCKWADEILDALETLHASDIIHRDLKPSNLKLTPAGQLKVLDFGIAKIDGSENSSIMEGSLAAATLQFAPLEQILRANDDWYFALSSSYSDRVNRIVEKGTDERSDLFSLGVTLYQLLTKRLPENAARRALLNWSGQLDNVTAAHDLNAQVPRKLSDVLQKAMSIDRSDRYESAKEMRDALSRVFQIKDNFIGHGRSASYYFNLGLQAAQNGNYKQSLEHFTKSIELRPNDAITITNRGNIYLSIGELDKAVKDYDRAIELNPDLPIAWMNRGNAYLYKKELNQAIDDYSKAIDLDPKEDDAWKNRASAYLSLGKLRLAFEDCQKALELNPSNEGAYYNLAHIFARSGQPEMAEKCRQKYNELTDVE